MSEGFICRRGGGAGLNFAVKAYPSVDSLPDSAAYNTIALITETKVTDWCFSDNEPTGLTEGSVWIPTGKGSVCPFNALKKREACITVQPLSAKQHVSGALTNIEAYIFSASGWVRFSSLIEYLYKNGETPYEWICVNTETGITETELVMTVSYWLFGGGYGSYGYMYINEPIAIPQGFTKLSIRYYCTTSAFASASPTHALVLRTECGHSSYCNDTGVVASVSIPPTTKETVVSLDIPESLWGQTLYVGTYYNSHGNYNDDNGYHIKGIWFE